VSTGHERRWDGRTAPERQTRHPLNSSPPRVDHRRGQRELRKINKVQEVCAPAGRDLDMSGRIGRAIVCFAAAGTLLYATSRFSAGSMAWRASSLLTPPSTAGEKEAPAVAYSTSPQVPETPQIAETTSSVPIATVTRAKPIRAARKPQKPTKPGLLPAPASGMAIQFSLAERGN
jgi:hypothetical protein